MELQKDKDLVQEVEQKNIDPEIGLDITIKDSALSRLEDQITESPSIKNSPPVEESLGLSSGEIEEVEEAFHLNMFDFDQLNNNTPKTELCFETEDLLPEILVQDEILKLLKDN